MKSYSPIINNILSSNNDSNINSEFYNKSINLCENNKILLNKKCYTFNDDTLIKFLKKKLIIKLLIQIKLFYQNKYTQIVGLIQCLLFFYKR